MAGASFSPKRDDLMKSIPPDYTACEPLLLSLAKKVGDLLLGGDEHHPWLIQHAAADFEAFHDLSLEPMTMVEFIRLARKLNAVHPHCRRLDILNSWVEWETAGDSKGSEEVSAVVWQFARVVMNSEGTVRDGLRVSRWRRRPEGVWLCYYYALWRCDPTASEQIAPCV